MASVSDPLDDLAAARQPLESSGGRHVMSAVGDKLTGIVTKAGIVDGKYGDLRVLRVDPHRAISAGVDTTDAGEVDLRCTGFELEAWFDREKPQAGDLVSLVLSELRDTGKDSPLKHYEAALRRDNGPAEQSPPASDDIPW